MSNFLSKEVWVFNTKGVDGTLTIGSSFVFLAYILHPAIESAYRRVRAYRAWRAIEKHQSVDVTNYPMVAEVFGGRGRWDAARVITVLLAFFSLASWGLELSMDLAYYEGDADLLNRPPPVTMRNDSGRQGWQVWPFTTTAANPSKPGHRKLVSDFWTFGQPIICPPEREVFGAPSQMLDLLRFDMRVGLSLTVRPSPFDLCCSYGSPIGWQVKTPEQLGDGDWRGLPNVFEGVAKSRYYMENTTQYEGAVNGAITVAHWYTEAGRTPSQFYYLSGVNATVNGLGCTDEDPEVMDVYLGDDTKWGTVHECAKGPSLTDDLKLRNGRKTNPPPTIVMTRYDDKPFLVVEESSSYPSFLYSVWTVGSVNGTSTELIHEFHIASTMRLAEAVVTGIVHGERSGGGCFGLLRKFSERRETLDSGFLRASPFGEHPTGDTVQIQALEHVEVGLHVGVNALACFVCLMVLASISIAWLSVLRASIGMDVYDRDELIRAVAMPRTTEGCKVPSEMRIFVRKEDSGHVRVVINDASGTQRGCARILRKGGNHVTDADPTATAPGVTPWNDGSGNSEFPMRSRTVVLEGIRLRQGRAFPGPNGNFRYPTSVSLTASCVVSNASSVTGTPVRYMSPPLPAVQMGRAYKGRRGRSVLVDPVDTPRDSEKSETDHTKESYASYDLGHGASRAYTSPMAGRRGVSAMSECVYPPDIEMPRRLDRDHGGGTGWCPPGRTTTEETNEPSPPPPSSLRRDTSLGHPPSGSSTRRCREESGEIARSPDDVC